MKAAPPLDPALWDLVRRTSATSGDQFFRELTRSIAAAMQVRYAIVSELSRPGLLHTLAIWTGEGWDNVDYELAGTPCGQVVQSGEFCFFPSGVREKFPDDPILESWAVEGYMGTPLVSSSGQVIGNLCLLDTRPLGDEGRFRAVVDPFASRAAAEIERIRVQQALECQHAFLRQVLDINPSLIFAKDREGRFTLANRAVAEAYGTTVEQLLGRTDADFNPNREEVQFFRKIDLEVMDTRQERFISEEPLTDAAGRLRWVQTIKRPIVDADDRVNHVLGVATDITELKRAREELVARGRREQEQVRIELQRVKDELVRQTRLAAIGQVAASIAHELRNPLGSINNAVYFLRRRSARLDAKSAEHVEIVFQEVQRSDAIIGNLLEMSRPKVPAKEPVDLRQALEETFARLRPKSAARVQLALEPERFVVDADPGQLRQVLANLVTNANQALGPGGGRITVAARREAEADVITFSDDGPGIPAELRESVFEPLFTTKAKGTGLGLSICRQILAQHGGTIELAAGRDGGATFEIRLPRPAPRPKSPR